MLSLNFFSFKNYALLIQKGNKHACLGIYFYSYGVLIFSLEKFQISNLGFIKKISSSSKHLNVYPHPK